MLPEHDDEPRRRGVAIFGLEHSTFDPKGGSLSGGEKAQYELGLGRWAERTDIVYSEVGNLPEFAQGDAVAFFAAADEHERVNGRRYTEIVLTMPSEFSDEQNIALSKEWAEQHLGTSHPYVLSFHKPERLRSDPEAQKLLENPELSAEDRRKLEQQMFQPHVHVLYTERTLTQENAEFAPDKWFSRVGAKKDRKWNDKDLIPELREEWSAQVNQALDIHAPDAQRVDHRSLKVQRAEAMAKVLEAHRLPEPIRAEEIQRAAERVAVLDREPEGRMTGVDRKLVRGDAKSEQRKERQKQLKEQLDASFETRRQAPGQEAVSKVVEQVSGKVSMLSQMREACFAAVDLVRNIGRLLREKRLEMQRAAEQRKAAELAAKQAVESEAKRQREAAEAAKRAELELLKPAITTNQMVLRVAADTEHGRSSTVTQAEVYQLADVCFGVKTAKRLHGQDRGKQYVEQLEMAILRQGKESIRGSLKGLADIDLERTAANGIEYAITPHKGKEHEFAAMLREGAKAQLQWDASVLRKQHAKEHEHPELENENSKSKSQQKDKSLGLGD